MSKLLTFGFLLAKEALGHLGEELLGRARGVEFRHHYTAAWGQSVRSEALEVDRGELLRY